MASADSTTERRSRREASLVMLAGALLVLAPVVVSEAPRERARWHFAAALEYEQAGNTQAALESLEQAIELDPFQPHFYMKRGELFYHRLDDLPRALEEMRQAIEVAPHDRVIETLMERAEFFQGLGGWELAVADWKLIERLFNKGYPGPSMLDTASMLNGLAYARALADVELEQALKNANEAVRREPRSPMFLDTRGYIFYRLGELGKASDDLDVAVDRFRQIWESEIRRDNEERRNRLITRDLKERRQQLDRAMATLLYHRLLVHDALLDEQAAAADEAEIRALGFDPNDPDELF